MKLNDADGRLRRGNVTLRALPAERRAVAEMRLASSSAGSRYPLIAVLETREAVGLPTPEWLQSEIIEALAELQTTAHREFPLAAVVFLPDGTQRPVASGIGKPGTLSPGESLAWHRSSHSPVSSLVSACRLLSSEYDGLAIVADGEQLIILGRFVEAVRSGLPIQVLIRSAESAEDSENLKALLLARAQLGASEIDFVSHCRPGGHNRHHLHRDELDTAASLPCRKVLYDLVHRFTSATEVGTPPTFGMLLCSHAPDGEVGVALEAAPPPLGHPSSTLFEPTVQLTRGQLALWFLHQLDPMSTKYHIAHAGRLTSAFDVHTFRKAVAEVWRRHEQLRLNILTIDGKPSPAVSPSGAPPITELFVDEGREPLVDALSRIAGAPFDIQAGPLARWYVVTSQSGVSLMYVRHHLVTDAWSEVILLSELGLLYDTALARKAFPSATRELSYADLSEAQEEFLSSKRAGEMREWWRAELAGVPEVLNLRGRIGGSSYSEGLTSDTVRVTLSGSLVENLRALGRTQQATLSSVLLAAYQAVLGRFSGQDDVVTAYPYSCRTSTSMQEVVGYLSNVAPIRGRMPETLTFAEHLSNTHQRVVEAMRRQDLPFSEVLREVAVPLSVTTPPLCQVSFVFQQTRSRASAQLLRFMAATDDDPVRLGSLTLQPIPVGGLGVEYWLSLTAVQTSDGLELVLTYDRAVVDRAWAESFCSAYRHFLAAIDEKRHVPLSAVPLCNAQASFADWTPLPTGTIHRSVEAVARRSPDRVAVRLGDTSLTYGELWAQARQVAARLQAEGVTEGDLVGVCLTTTPNLVIAILGVLCAGAGYVPLDPSYPSGRLRYLASDAECRVILNETGDSLDGGTGYGRTIAMAHLLREQSLAEVRPTVDDARSVAYCIYTSGSTGDPKGVLVSHENVVRLFSSSASQFGFSEADKWVLFHSYAFDFSVWETFGALLHGGTLVLVDPEIRRSPSRLIKLLGDEGVTVLNQTPSAFLGLRDEILRQNVEFPSLRLIIFGGEVLSPQILQPWFERFGDHGPALINMYGITETTVHVTQHRLRQLDAERGRHSPIGKPLPDLSMIVVDAGGNPVPDGVPGELFVGGRGVAIGYRNRPDLTAERFAGDPTGQSSERYYRTGDVVRRLADGSYDYVGRCDDQLKVRGYRVEPAEIEAALIGHEAVADSLVTVDQQIGNNPRLVAYIVTIGRVPSAAELRTFVGDRLPAHLVPSKFVQVSAIPRLENGKVNRRGFVPSVVSEDSTLRSYVEPRNDQERTAVSLWADILGRPDIGIDDDFFDLGGDSITSVSLAASMQSAGFDVSVERIFELRTIRSLLGAPVAARRVPADLGAMSGPSYELPEGVAKAYRLSALQSGMLFHSEADSTSDVYLEIFSVRLALPVNLTALQAAVDDVVSRHEALRASFDLVSGPEPLQYIHQHLATPLAVYDLRGQQSVDLEASLAGFRDAERRKRFSVENAPLLRVSVHLIDLGVQFSISFHHVLMDGWSLANVMSEILRHYLHSLGRAPALLTSAPTLLAEYTQLERAAVNDAEDRQFWAAEVASVASRGVFGTKPSVGRSEAGRTERTVDPECQRALQLLANRLHVPLRTVLLTAHLAVMGHLTGETSVTTGVITNGRPEVEGGSRAVGLFLNTVPFSMDLQALRWEALIEAVATKERAILPRRRLPLPEILKLAPDGFQFEHVFNYIHMHVYREQLGSELDRAFAGFDVYEHTNHPMTVTFRKEVTADALVIATRFLRPRFTVEQGVAVTEALCRALESIAADPTALASACQLLGPSDLADATTASRPQPALQERPHSIAALLSVALDKYAERDALAAGQWKYTFAELRASCGAVLRDLEAAGLCRGDRVAVDTRSEAATVVALVASLLGGFPFVPLDPTLPDMRRRLILEQAGVAALLYPEGQPAEAIGIGRPSIPVSTRPTAGRNPDGDLPSDHDAAYVLYTSGSSGVPKGVIIEQGQLAGYVEGVTEWLGVRPGLRWGSPSSFAWDFSFTCLFGALATGGTFVLAPDLSSGEADLAGWLLTARLDVLKILPALLSGLISGPGSLGLLPAEILMFGGEAVEWPLVDRVRALRTDLGIVNHYGPTETCVGALAWRYDSGVAARGFRPPIGRPLPHARAQVVDQFGRPSPVGVPGELWIGGMGVARGYVKEDESVAERFVVGSVLDPEGRYYRTGDRVRRLPEGNIEFLGREDGQVKVRGHRLELSEVEAVAAGHPAISEVATVFDPSKLGDVLVLYAVARNEYDPTADVRAQLEMETLESWESTLSEVYAELGDRHGEIASVSSAGWNNSLTGQPFSKPEMDEYVADCVAAVTAGGVPRSVLEVGCGTGLITFALAPHVERYTGLDFSAQAVQYVRQLSAERRLNGVEVRHLRADQLSELSGSSYDAVIFPSVIQKFPSVEYLDEVIEAAIRLVKTPGRIVLTDVRDLALLEYYHTWVQLHRASDSDTASELAERVKRSIAGEEELLVAQRYFCELLGRRSTITGVSINLKQGRIQNELTDFRYNVVLTVGGSVAAASSAAEVVEEADLRGVLQRLESGVPRTVRFPNDRLTRHVEAARLVSSADRSLRKPIIMRRVEGKRGVDPDDVRLLGAQPGSVMEIGATPHGALAEVSFNHEYRPVDGQPSWPISALASDPLRHLRLRRRGEEVRKYLAARLPRYMVPGSVVWLESLPRLPNGKLDRRGLPSQRDARSEVPASYIPPSGATELRLAELWEEALGIAPIGAEDDFVRLGGDSLTALGLVARMRKEFGHAFPIMALYRGATIAELASQVGKVFRQESAGETSVHLMAVQDRSLAYCLPPVGGAAFCYSQLAARLSDTVQLVGLQTPGLDAPSAPLETIEHLAEVYLDEIRAVQATGPYWLLGYSMGGVLALEVSLRLQEVGEQVAFLGMIDSLPPGSVATDEVLVDESEVRRWVEEQRLPPLGTGRALREFVMLARRLREGDEGQPAAAEQPAAEERLRCAIAVYNANIGALRKYKPARKYVGSCLIVEAIGTIGRSAARQRWGEHIDGTIELIRAAGDHDTIMAEPFVAAVADSVRSALMLLPSDR